MRWPYYRYFQGYAIHDHWASYYGYDCQHVLFNSHHLRELTFAQEKHQQRWAGEFSKCLLEAKQEVDDAKALNVLSLDTSHVTYFERRYSHLLRAGRDGLPVLSAGKNKKRGKKKQHKVKNFHDRLINHKKEVLAFLYDFSLPFDNKLAERNVRMVKVKQKISGCFRPDQGAKTFCCIRGYVSTIKKLGHNVFSALCDTFDGAALTPTLSS